MKLAILSDIHGNLNALEKVLDKIEEMDVDGIVWCGDYITDVPKSHEVLQVIRNTMERYPSWIVKGNREDYIIDYHNSEEKNWTLSNNTGALLLTYEDLTDEDMSFIEGLPDELVIKIEDAPEIYLNHKYPKKKVKQEYILFGHEHIPIYLHKKSKIVLNPGSVGMPTTGRAGIDFLTLKLENQNWIPEFHHIDYDIEEVVEVIENSKMPDIAIGWGDALIALLRTGFDYPAYYIEEARKISVEYGSYISLEDLEIEIWMEARGKLKF